MKYIFNAKYVKMIAALTVILLILATMIPAQAQAAEAKWYKGQPGYASDCKVKIGGGYFWYEYEYTEDSTITVLRYSAKKSGNGVKLASIDSSSMYGNTVMFNGSKVYYTTMTDPFSVDDSGKIKIKIHSVSKTGKNRKTLKTITASDNCLNTTLLNVYNGRLYFTRYNLNWEGEVTEGKLFSMNMSGDSYKVIRHSSEFPYADAAGNSRYIYAKAGNGEYYGQSNPLKVFDCKEKKVIRTIKNVYKYVCSGGKLYYAVTAEEGGVKAIYSASASGKDKKKVLELGSKYRYGNLFKDSVYYYASEGGVYFKYYLKDGTSVEIDEWAFLESQGPMGM